MGEIYGQEINSNDPEFFIKATVLEHTNYLHDKMREDKDRIYSKIYFAISLVLTILSSFFIKYIDWLSILFLANLLMILLVVSANKYKKQKIRFGYNRKQMKESFKNLGLEWRD